MNPGVFLGPDSTEQNLNLRRELSLSGQNPAAALLIGNLERHTNLGTQDYRFGD